MTGYTQNNRGRYKCNYCDHSTYKTWGGVTNHISERHPLELERDKAVERAEYAEKAKKELSRQLADATKPSPKPKEPEYWYPQGAGVYCPTCRIVNRNVGIPVSQTIENTPHNPCSNRGLMLVTEIK